MRMGVAAQLERAGTARPLALLLRFFELRRPWRLAAVPAQIGRDLVRDFLRKLLRIDLESRLLRRPRFRQWAHLPTLW